MAADIGQASLAGAERRRPTGVQIGAFASIKMERQREEDLEIVGQLGDDALISLPPVVRESARPVPETTMGNAAERVARWDPFSAGVCLSSGTPNLIGSPSKEAPRMNTAPSHLKPRKRPRQARAAATVDAIFEATIQILVLDGPARLTTTRVAERAGVSVGTMYQYFPHKQALFYAVNERYLDVLAGKVEVACQTRHGVPIAEMVEALVTTYWNAKTERPDVTRALYRSVVEIDNGPLLETFVRRVDAATAAMFASAPDASFADLPIVNLTLLTSIFGTVRSVFERSLPAFEGRAVHRQLILMCCAYLEAARLPQPEPRKQVERYEALPVPAKALSRT